MTSKTDFSFIGRGPQMSDDCRLTAVQMRETFNYLLSCSSSSSSCCCSSSCSKEEQQQRFAALYSGSHKPRSVNRSSVAPSTSSEATATAAPAAATAAAAAAAATAATRAEHFYALYAHALRLASFIQMHEKRERRRKEARRLQTLNPKPSSR